MNAHSTSTDYNRTMALLIVNVDLIVPAYLTKLTKDLQIIVVPQNFSQQTTYSYNHFLQDKSINGTA